MCGMTNTTGSGDKMEVIEWGNLMGDGKNEAMFTKDDDIASLTIQLSAALRREEVLREALNLALDSYQKTLDGLAAEYNFQSADVRTEHDYSLSTCDEVGK